jgi:hypothetical protein
MHSRFATALLAQKRSPAILRQFDRRVEDLAYTLGVHRSHSRA